MPIDNTNGSRNFRNKEVEDAIDAIQDHKIQQYFMREYEYSLGYDLSANSMEMGLSKASKLADAGRIQPEFVDIYRRHIRAMQQRNSEDEKAYWENERMKNANSGISVEDISLCVTDDPDIIIESKLNISEASIRNSSGSVDIEIEEFESPEYFGDLMFHIIATIDYTVYPGEEMVRYYPDGSGNPGSPPEADWNVSNLQSVEAYDSLGDQVAFELSDINKQKLVEAITNNLGDLIEERVFEHANDSYDDSYEND